MNKQLEIQEIITYRWWRIDGKDIPDNTKVTDRLEFHAKNQIATQRLTDFTSGELVFKLDDIEYQGHWELKTTKRL